MRALTQSAGGGGARARAFCDRRSRRSTCPARSAARSGGSSTMSSFAPTRRSRSWRKLKPAFRAGGSVTAGNSSGINDGAAALLVASEHAVKSWVSSRSRGGRDRGGGRRAAHHGDGPGARRLARCSSARGCHSTQIDVIELNEAFAAAGRWRRLRSSAWHGDDPRVNPNGGAIALGHPLGMSGARLMLSAARELRGDRRALRARHHVRRRRAGNGHDHRANLTGHRAQRRSSRSRVSRPVVASRRRLCTRRRPSSATSSSGATCTSAQRGHSRRLGRRS